MSNGSKKVVVLVGNNRRGNQIIHLLIASLILQTAKINYKTKQASKKNSNKRTMFIAPGVSFLLKRKAFFHKTLLFLLVNLLINHTEALDSVQTMSRGVFVISEKGESA